MKHIIGGLLLSVCLLPALPVFGQAIPGLGQAVIVGLDALQVRVDPLTSGTYLVSVQLQHELLQTEAAIEAFKASQASQGTPDLKLALLQAKQQAVSKETMAPPGRDIGTTPAPAKYEAILKKQEELAKSALEARALAAIVANVKLAGWQALLGARYPAYGSRVAPIWSSVPEYTQGGTAHYNGTVFGMAGNGSDLAGFVFLSADFGRQSLEGMFDFGSRNTLEFGGQLKPSGFAGEIYRGGAFGGVAESGAISGGFYGLGAEVAAGNWSFNVVGGSMAGEAAGVFGAAK